jgi:hypothetical protein
MCDFVIEPLTLATLLNDPLTRMVMRSDGVSEQEFAALWEQVRGSLRAPDLCEAEPALA